MSKNLIHSLALLSAFWAIGMVAVDASAATLRVTCEHRADRSRASVDGSNLASGDYSAVLASGSQSAQSLPTHTRGDQVQFDFDSNPRDIRKGATPIDKDFIADGSATGTLLDASGAVVVKQTVKCRQR